MHDGKEKIVTTPGRWKMQPKNSYLVPRKMENITIKLNSTGYEGHCILGL